MPRERDVRTYSKYYSRLGRASDVSFEGHTLLHDAAVGGTVAILANLIHDGLQINIANWMGLTPLWYAVSEKRLKRRNICWRKVPTGKLKPWKTKSAYPKMKEGFDLLCQAEATLGHDHRLTKMLRDLRK